MVVRFLPVPDRDAQANPDPAPEREGLAEVVELRSRLLGAVARTDVEEWPGDSGGDEPPRKETRRRLSAVRAPSERQLNRPRAVADAEEPEQASGPSRTATEDGVRVLSRRARSAGEVRRALLDLGHDASEVEDVLAEFSRSGYLDDADLARALTASLRERSKASRSQIRRKLMERKLPEVEIEAALSELDAEDEVALVREAALQRVGRMRDLDRVTAERRLLGFLARRGWSGESARSAVNEALESVGPRR